MAASIRWGLLLLLAVVGCASPDGSAEGDGQSANPGESSDDVVASSPSGVTNASGSAGDGSEGKADPPEPDLVVHSLANLGDSISQGFDADDAKPLDLNQVVSNHDAVFHDNASLSWVQGSDARVGSVASHYKAKDDKLVVTPISRSGAELVGKSTSLPNLEKQARAIATKNVTPDLVYVLLGGNDVCNRQPSKTSDATATLYSVEEWRAAAVKGLVALAEVLPAGATVRFVSMPRVDLLYEALKDTTVPVKVSSPLGPVDGTSTCADLWTVTASQGAGICKIVTTETNAARRKAIGERIDAYNTALAEEVRKMDTDPTRNPKKISFQSDWHGSLDAGAVKNSSVGTFVFQPSHVSKLDCFHPSIAGQHEIASHVLSRAKWKP